MAPSSPPQWPPGEQVIPVSMQRESMQKNPHSSLSTETKASCPGGLAPCFFLHKVLPRCQHCAALFFCTGAYSSMLRLSIVSQQILCSWAFGSFVHLFIYFFRFHIDDIAHILNAYVMLFWPECKSMKPWLQSKLICTFQNLMCKLCACFFHWA